MLGTHEPMSDYVPQAPLLCLGEELCARKDSIYSFAVKPETPLTIPGAGDAAMRQFPPSRHIS